MDIGIPREVKAGETRVAVSPDGIATLVGRGHSIWVQRGAGRASGWSDAAYRRAGARVVPQLDDVYRRATLICKVKEPQPKEIRLLRPDHILFTFLHLAGNRKLLQALRRRQCIAIAYETIRAASGQLPLLEPMSEIAGRMALQLGVNFLRADQGGRGVMVAPGTSATVGIIGAGHVGRSALDAAVGLGAQVWVLDAKDAVLRRIRQRYGRGVKTGRATATRMTRLIRGTDLLIGAVLVPARRAPRIVTRAMVKGMATGAVIVDVAIDQGGCVETSRVTSIARPTFTRYGVVHCAIPNLPALVPRTASARLAASVLPYLRKLATWGWERAAKRNPAIAAGLNIVNGTVVHPALD